MYVAREIPQPGTVYITQGVRGRRGAVRLTGSGCAERSWTGAPWIKWVCNATPLP